jgi:hypothetical protein
MNDWAELDGDGQNPLVHLWSARNNLTRRILRVREQSQDRIVLEVRRFGRAPQGASPSSNRSPACTSGDACTKGRGNGP